MDEVLDGQTDIFDLLDDPRTRPNNYLTNENAEQQPAAKDPQ